jgi:hypothetical protein
VLSRVLRLAGEQRLPSRASIQPDEEVSRRLSVRAEQKRTLELLVLMKVEPEIAKALCLTPEAHKIINEDTAVIAGRQRAKKAK